jgi:hypothetical protein
MTVYRVLRPIPAVGAVPGDFLVLRPWHRERPLILYRTLSILDLHVLGIPDAVEVWGETISGGSPPLLPPGRQRNRLELVGVIRGPVRRPFFDPATHSTHRYISCGGESGFNTHHVVPGILATPPAPSGTGYSSRLVLAGTPRIESLARGSCVGPVRALLSGGRVLVATPRDDRRSVTWRTVYSPHMPQPSASSDWLANLKFTATQRAPEGFF